MLPSRTAKPSISDGIAKANAEEIRPHVATRIGSIHDGDNDFGRALALFTWHMSGEAHLEPWRVA